MKTPIDPNSIYETSEVAEIWSVSNSTVIRWAKARLVQPMPGCRKPFKFLGERLLEFARGNASTLQQFQRRAA